VILATVCLVLKAYILVLVLFIVLGYFPMPAESNWRRLRDGVSGLVQPVVAPIRRVVPPVQAGSVSFDLSLLIVFVAVTLLQGLLCR
jgi:YggT family protein